MNRPLRSRTSLLAVFLAAALFAPPALLAQPFTFTTLAGAPGGSGMADGPAARAQYASPSGVAVDAAGNIYVADAGNNVVRKISVNGEVTTLAGTPGVEDTEDVMGASDNFSFPEGMAVDSAGNVYVSDSSAHIIRKITPAGGVTSLAGSPNNPGSNNGTGNAARFRNPRGLAVDGAGNVYVADHDNHLIRRITPAGIVTTFAGGDGAAGFADGFPHQARFNKPAGLAFDAFGTLHVADRGNNRIRRINSAGLVSTLAGSGLRGDTDGTGNGARFDEPIGIAVNAAGIVYVVDTENNSIRRITDSGVVTTLAGSRSIANLGYADGPGTAAKFRYPQFLALDPAGNVIVTDSGNHVIRRITATGVVSTISGLPPSAGSLDGIGDEAQFTSPSALTVDSTGIVYVADATTHTIRRIAPGGLVTAFAGAPDIAGADNGSGGSARFNRPSGLTTDATGNVYVADRSNHTIRRITSAGVVTTVAGSAGEPGSTNGTVTAARFSSPQDVAVDPAGNLYVADSGNLVIRRISTAGIVTTLAGSVGQSGFTDGTGSDARFRSTNGLTIDGAGNLFVVDGPNRTIRKVTIAGVVTTFAGATGVRGTNDGTGTAALFFDPQKIASDATGNLYVTDRDAHILRRVSATGVVTTIGGTRFTSGNADGTGGAARFFFPEGVAFDRAGNLYVADAENHCIRWGATAVPTPTGPLTANAVVGQPFSFTASFAGAISGPYQADGFPPGLSFNATTGVLSGVPSVPGTFGVDLIATNGAGIGFATLTLAVTGGTPASELYTFTTLAGTANTEGSTNGFGAAARFHGPAGVAVDASGNVFVADRFNRTVRKIATGGAVTTLAGTAGVNGTADGAGIEAGFVSPSAIAVDRSGNLYVTDTNSHTIRKITSAGVVSTLAGVAGDRGSTNGTGTQARFDSPEGVAVDGSGTLFVTDTSNRVIRRISANGVVTTFAGLTDNLGSTDGTRDVARFAAPSGIAIDAAGNLYIADTANRTIRKVTPAGVVSTLAGSAGNAGTTDGTGDAARFRRPTGIVVDRAGNIFVADNNGQTLRKITSTGVVTTIAGSADIIGSTNGTGPAARFSSPNGLALDSAGNLYVADMGNHVIRWGALTTPTFVSANAASAAVGQRFSYAARFSGTLVGPFTATRLPAGLRINSLTGVISGAPTEPGTFTIALGATNGAGPATATLTLTVVGAPPTLAAQPANLNVSVGGPATFTVAAGGSAPLSYQWRRNGAPITGATQATLTLPNTSSADAGSYNVTVSNSLGAITSAPAALTVIPLSALSNLSVRTPLATGQILIVGAVVTGSAKTIVVRAAGPALNQFGLAGLADPRLELFTGGMLLAAINEDWDDGLTSLFTSLGAFPFPPGSRDAALAQPLAGSFTVQARGPGAGAVLVEAYDAGGGFLPRMVNLSARNQVGTGADVLIAGFAIAGTGTKQLLIRAIGPALTAFGVTGALADPRLQVFNSGGTVIATNDNWDASLAARFTQVGAFPLTAGSRDAALLLTVNAGTSYTVQVDGVGGGTGEALVEIYEVF